MSKENSLKKMKRKDLLEILLLQNKKINELEIELNKAKELLTKREIVISEAGSIAEASLKLNGVFEVAQRAADDYLKSVMEMDKNNHEKKKLEYNKKMVIKKNSEKSKECLE